VSVDVVKCPERAQLLAMAGSYGALVTRSAAALDAEVFAAAAYLRVAERAACRQSAAYRTDRRLPGGWLTERAHSRDD
jgi:hypothetical protein